MGYLLLTKNYAKQYSDLRILFRLSVLFIDGTPHSAGIRALGDCEVFNIHRADFEALMERDPDMVYKVMRAIVRAAHRIQRRMNFQYTQLTDYISHQHGRF